MGWTGSLDAWGGLAVLVCGVDWQSWCVGWTESLDVWGGLAVLMCRMD